MKAALKKLFTRVMNLDKTSLETQFKLLFARLKSLQEAKKDESKERKDGFTPCVFLSELFVLRPAPSSGLCVFSWIALRGRRVPHECRC